MSKLLVGIIAEDLSDTAVLEACIQKIAPSRIRGFRVRVGEGCGSIVHKCSMWAAQLAQSGCNALVVSRDSDGLDVDVLREQISRALAHSTIKRRTTVIPVQEIEAWLLCDMKAIRLAMNIRNQIKPIGNPESIRDPKKRLGQVVYSASNKTRIYVNTVHNGRIAKEIALSNLRSCASFRHLEQLFQS